MYSSATELLASDTSVSCADLVLQTTLTTLGSMSENVSGLPRLTVSGTNFTKNDHSSQLSEASITSSLVTVSSSLSLREPLG